MSKDNYRSPWDSRYSSKEMLRIFSDQNKYSLWRRLWVALAEGQQALGLTISDDQIQEMRAHVDQIDFDEALLQEERCKHDVHGAYSYLWQAMSEGQGYYSPRCYILLCDR